MEFNIQRQGRKWTRAEVEQKYHKLCPEKIELIEGKMFWTDEERLNMLALLLENVGMDAAVSLAGMIYVLAGVNNDVGDLSTMEVYDPVADAWSPVAPLPTLATPASP